MVPLILVGLTVSALTALSLGANDLANSVAPIVGSNILSFRRAVFLFFISTFIGAILQGYMVMKTLGKGVVSDIEVVGAISASLAAFIWIITASIKGIPISTTHSITGGVLGIGIAYTFLEGRASCINLGVISKIVLSWITSPLSAMILAVFLYFITEKLLNQYNNRYVTLLALFMAALAAYSFGANDVANAVGIYISITSKTLGLPDFTAMRILAIFSIIFVGLGGALLGRKVVETMAYKITKLDATTSISANADAIAVWLYTTIPYILFGYGMPISTTYAAAGAIIGAGIARHRSLKAINVKLVLFIMFAWVLTLPVTSSLAIAIYSLLKYLLLR